MTLPHSMQIGQKTMKPCRRLAPSLRAGREQIMASNHLVYDRSAQKSGGQEVYWMAWEEGKTVETMERVVWKLIDPIANRWGWIKWDITLNVPKLEGGHQEEWTPYSTSPWTIVR